MLTAPYEARRPPRHHPDEGGGHGLIQYVIERSVAGARQADRPTASRKASSRSKRSRISAREYSGGTATSATIRSIASSSPLTNRSFRARQIGRAAGGSCIRDAAAAIAGQRLVGGGHSIAGHSSLTVAWSSTSRGCTRRRQSRDRSRGRGGRRAVGRLDRQTQLFGLVGVRDRPRCVEMLCEQRATRRREPAGRVRVVVSVARRTAS
jgi:hypothetical protein